MFELMYITILTRCEYLSFPNSTLNYPYRIHRGFALSLDSRGTSNMDDGGGERRGRRERAPSRKVAESEESKAEEAREREQNKRKRQEQKKQKETASTAKGGTSSKASKSSKKTTVTPVRTTVLNRAMRPREQRAVGV